MGLAESTRRAPRRNTIAMSGPHDLGVPHSDPGLISDEVRRLSVAGRFVDNDVVGISTTESRWLLDLTRRRFQRCRPDGDARRALRFGRWSSFTRVDIDGGCLVVERARRPTVRAQVSPG
jgi:hypothetical protein